jgi:sphingomyelin phosphodiesterase acid-like 3
MRIVFFCCIILTFLLARTASKEPDSTATANLLGTPATKQPQSAAGQGQFLSLSDLHFDPFAFAGLTDTLTNSPVTQWTGIFESVAKKYGYGNYGDDTNYNLFISALQKMKAVNANPHFIVMTGDFISHDFGANFQQQTGITNPDSLFLFIHKTLQFVTNTIESYFPGITLFPALGNNDSYCGDYQAESSGIFYNQVGSLWYPLVKNVTSRQAFMKSFGQGGYYAADNPAGNKHRVIVLNTVMNSTSYNAFKYPNYCGKTLRKPDAINVQMNWLKQQLQLCRMEKKKAWLLYHIPPGINAYSSSGGSDCVKSISPFWTDSTTAVFTSLLSQYRDVVELNMAGHTHMDNFELVTDSTGGAFNFVHITPSISPIFNNSPAFEEIMYDTVTTRWTDYTTYYLGNLNDSSAAPWNVEYNFNSAYGENMITAQTLQQVYKKIYSDTVIRKKYIQYYDASNPFFTAITPKNFMAYWCAAGTVTRKQYAGCACVKNDHP